MTIMGHEVFGKILEKIVEKNTLIRVVHRNKEGRLLRVSNFLKKGEGVTPETEMIYHRDGSSKLYLYNDRGLVEKIFDYDANGLELSCWIPVRMR